MSDQQPETLTVKEALEQGYKYASSEEGEFCIRLDKVEDLEGMELFLADKEPFFLSVDPVDIYQDLAENFAINNEVNDEDDSIGDLIRETIDWQSIADRLTEVLKNHPFYRPSKIKLIP